MLALALSFLTVILLVILCVAVAIIRNHNYLKAVPKPPGHWILGHYLEFRDPTDFLRKASICASKYNGLMRICLPPSWTVVVITDRDVTRRIFEETIDKSTDYDYFKPWLGTGLLTSKGDKWKQRRRLLAPCFGSLELMKGFISVFETLGVDLIAKLQKEVGNINLDLIPFMKRYTLDVLCESSMGVSLTSDGESYRESLESLCGVLVNRLKVPYKRIDCLFRFTKDYHIQKQSIKVIDSLFDEIFENKSKLLMAGRKITGKRLAFLDLLMEFFKTGELSKDDIRAEVNTIMFGGHDTTAAGLAFTLYSLANNPHIQEKVVEEQINIFGSLENTDQLTIDNIQQMRYLEMVIHEALRLYPPIPVIARQLPNKINCGDITLPKDLNVIIFIYGAHHDPIYFPDPEKFIPERFENGEVLPFTHFPYSIGQRSCIGKKFGLIEMKSCISKIVRNFKLLPSVPVSEPKLVHELTLTSLNGVKISIERRKYNKNDAYFHKKGCSSARICTDGCGNKCGCEKGSYKCSEAGYAAYNLVWTQETLYIARCNMYCWLSQNDKYSL